MDWSHPRVDEYRLDDAPPESKRVATAVWERTQQHADRLDQPDTWFDVATSTLLWAPRPGAFPLCVGDLMQYTQVLRVAFVTHDALYVGKGHIVCMTMENDDDEFKKALKRPGVQAARAKGYKSFATASLKTLDKTNILGKRWLDPRSVKKNQGVTLAQRKERVRRALSSLATYRYCGINWNCQHICGLWLGDDQPYSLGLERLVGGATIIICVVLVAAIVCVAVRAARRTR